MAHVVVEMSGDEAKLYRSFQKIIDQQKRLEQGLEKTKQKGQQTGQALRGAGQSGAQAFGAVAVRSLASYAAGFTSIHTAIRLATTLMREYRQEQERAVAETENLEEARKRLREVARGPSDLAVMEARADYLAGMYGITRVQARQIKFAARSTGFEGPAEELIARGAATYNVETMTKVAGNLPLIMREQINATQALNAAAVASEMSAANFEAIAENLATVAEGGMQAGADPAEVIASLSALTSIFKNPETAAQRLNRFYARLSMIPELQGMGGVEAAQALEAMPEQKRDKLLGEAIQVRAAYVALRDFADLVKERTAIVQQQFGVAGTGQDTFSRMLALTYAPDTVSGERAMARMQAKAAESRRLAAEERFAPEEYRRQTVVDTAREMMQREGVGFFDRTMFRGYLGLLKTFGASAETLEREARNAPQAGWVTGSNVQWQQRWDETIERLGRAAANLETATRPDNRAEQRQVTQPTE